jgi:hypothetical protein
LICQAQILWGKRMLTAKDETQRSRRKERAHIKRMILLSASPSLKRIK